MIYEPCGSKIVYRYSALKFLNVLTEFWVAGNFLSHHLEGMRHRRVITRAKKSPDFSEATVDGDPGYVDE